MIAVIALAPLIVAPAQQAVNETRQENGWNAIPGRCARGIVVRLFDRQGTQEPVGPDPFDARVR